MSGEPSPEPPAAPRAPEVPHVPEVTTVADDEVVLHVPSGPGRPARVRRYRGLAPGTVHDLDGVAVRTLDRPPGELLATVATVNDLHFGETRAGHIEGLPEIGPVLSSEPGEEPYPELMNRAAADEIAAADPAPALVVAKGDLTDAGARSDLDAFFACYARFGDRLAVVPGNHDVAHGPVRFGEPPFDRRPPFAVAVPGAVCAVIDTTIVGAPGGRVGAEQLAWLADVAAGAEDPVLVFGHHHVWDPASRQRPDGYFGIHPDDSEALVAVAARHRMIAGYFAGHTHRSRVRRFAATGGLPWVEVASVKEFPGAWAEYRIFEGGVLQVLRRSSAPAALRWSERTRALFGGTFVGYAFGRVEDRCFEVAGRRWR